MGVGEALLAETEAPREMNGGVILSGQEYDAATLAPLWGFPGSLSQQQQRYRQGA